MNFYSTFCFLLLIIMVEFNSQLSGIQHEEQISEPESGVLDKNSRQQISTCLFDEPNQFFDSTYPIDTASWYTKQEENKGIDISYIIQLLRNNKAAAM
jgi:hypothetical protein